MPPRKRSTPEPTPSTNGSIIDLTKELWEAAVQLRGSIEPADYKRYVLPIIFLRFLSLRFEKRRAELEALIADPKSDYHGDQSVLEDPDEYRAASTFIVPKEARWSRIASGAKAAQRPILHFHRARSRAIVPPASLNLRLLRWRYARGE